MPKRARVALAGVLLIAAWPAWAQDAAGWMARMGEALTGLDYHGELVYSHAGQIETLRVFHASGPDGGRERLVTLSGGGAPREVIRAGGQVTSVGTGPRPAIYADTIATARPLGALHAIDAQALHAHYLLALGPTERVAGLETQRVQVLPRDAYRYGYQLWLERETGLPLKTVRVGVDGRPVELLMFTRIALRERPSEADLAGAGVGGASQTRLELPQSGTAAPANWRVIEPPTGFALTLQPARGGASEHLVYSDGLASVSVYVEPLTATVPAFSGPASRGSVNLYGRVIAGHQITVLGDVPAATVERFAQGVAASGG